MSKALAVVSTAMLLPIGLSAVLAWQGSETGAEIAELWERRERARALADELRQSSDDLTRMARTYAAAGDDRYRRYYREILDIRNGELPRPENYRMAYWDPVAAEGARPGKTGRAVALRELVEGAGFIDAERALLTEAEDESNLLAELERDAFAAVREGDLQAARSLLYSDAYHRAKARIMSPIRRSVQAMEKRTAREIERLTRRRDELSRYLLTATAVLLALAAAAAGLALTAARRSRRTTGSG